MYEYTLRIYDNGFDKKSITCGLRRFDDVTYAADTLAL